MLCTNCEAQLVPQAKIKRRLRYLVWPLLGAVSRFYLFYILTAALLKYLLGGK